MPNWQEIVEREGKAVWQTVYRILGNRADADECFQEAFLAAWEVSRRGQVQNWRALLLRLAAARAVDRLRQRHRCTAREQTADWEAVPGHEPSPSQRLWMPSCPSAFEPPLLACRRNRPRSFASIASKAGAIRRSPSNWRSRLTRGRASAPGTAAACGSCWIATPKFGEPLTCERSPAARAGNARKERP